MFKKPHFVLALVSAALFSLLATYFVIGFVAEKQEETRARDRQEQRIILNMEKWHVKSRAEQIRQFAIEDATTPVSDADLDFILEFLKAPNYPDAARTLRKQGAITTLIVLTRNKRLNNQQREKVINAVVPLLTAPGKSCGDLVLLYALCETRLLKEQRLVLLVTPLTNHPNPRVKKAAAMTLAHLQQKR